MTSADDDARAEKITPAAKKMGLRYAGVCRRCGAELPAGEPALYDRASRTVSCLECATPCVPLHRRPDVIRGQARFTWTHPPEYEHADCRQHTPRQQPLPGQLTVHWTRGGSSQRTSTLPGSSTGHHAHVQAGRLRSR